MYNRKYNSSYSSFKTASKFNRKPTGTFKTKPFYKKSYYSHKHKSTNSATTGHGRVFKTI